MKLLRGCADGWAAYLRRDSETSLENEMLSAAGVFWSTLRHLELGPATEAWTRTLTLGRVK